MNSIIVIHPYFGKFPNWFSFWLDSCRLNTTVDFLIATDQTITCSSENIYVWQTTLEEIKGRIETYTKMSVWLEHPYKLCDFRPLFKEIFKEYTSKYDFWGYCDSDLIFGDIRSFLTEDILNRYDFILGWGHFHIQRVQDPKYEEVWKSARGLWRNVHWKEVFQSDKNEWFDELPYGVSGRYYDLYPDRCWMGYTNNHVYYESPASSCLVFRSLFNDYELWKNWVGFQKHLKRLPFFYREPGGDLQNIVYRKDGIKLTAIGTNDNGEIEERSFLYVHFYKRILDVKTDNLIQYIICPNMFVSYRKLNRILLLYYSHHPSIYWKYVKQQIIQKYFRLRGIVYSKRTVSNKVLEQKIRNSDE